jgi:hypothetical protein
VLSKNIKIEIYRTTSFPVVWCGFETGHLTVREEHRLRLLKNGVLRKIFGSERDEVLREWEGHYEELHDVLCALNIVQMIKSKRMIWARCVAHMGDRRGLYRCGGKRQLGRHRLRWEDNIKWILKKWDC